MSDVCSGYDVIQRPQFTFQANERTLASFLTYNVTTPVRVNVVAISQMGSQVKLVVGPANPVTNPTAQQEQVDQLLANLRIFHLTATRQEILQINNLQMESGTPGSYRVAYAALTCQQIAILASYFGEPVDEVPTTFFEVPPSKLHLARTVLCNFNLQTADDTLCININNVVASSPPQWQWWIVLVLVLTVVVLLLGLALIFGTSNCSSMFQTYVSQYVSPRPSPQMAVPPM